MTLTDIKNELTALKAEPFKLKTDKK